MCAVVVLVIDSRDDTFAVDNGRLALSEPIASDIPSADSEVAETEGDNRWSADRLRELAESGASTEVQRDALRSALRERGISDAQVHAVMAHTEEAIILRRQKAPSSSWVGGDGAFPPGTVDWPRNDEEMPFTPVAHFDLDHLPQLPPPFPRSGIIQVFYDFGWVETEPHMEAFAEAGRAYLLDDEAVGLQHPGDDIFREEPMYLSATLMPVAGEPHRVIDELGGFDKNKNLIDAMNELTLDLYGHQIGGRPREFQGDVLSDIRYVLDRASPEFRSRYTAEERTSPDAWRLLATIEPEGAMMFGEAGNLYVVIPKVDLQNKRFDRAIGIAQGA